MELTAGEAHRLGALEVSLTAVYEQMETFSIPTRPSVATLLKQASGTFLEAAGKPCGVCYGLEGKADMVLCDRCGDCYHEECLNEGGQPPVALGPWICQ